MKGSPHNVLFPISQKALQTLLFIIDRLGGSISGKTKLIKLLFLIETEGKVKFDVPIRQGFYGPYRDNEYNYALSSGLIVEEKETTFERHPIEIEISWEGRRKLRGLGSVLNKAEIQKAEKIIGKYSSYTSTSIKEYVYSKYLEKYGPGDVGEFEDAIAKLIPIANMKLENASNAGARTLHKQIKLVGYLEHVKGILAGMRSRGVDKTERSVLLNAIRELVAILANKNYSMEGNPESEELCDFIDNYATVHGIAGPIGAGDFSDFSEAEKECVAEVLENL
ncbi:MAG: hypothetical protein AB1657_00390 [Candidatus Micrarchaeota archaeon]